MSDELNSSAVHEEKPLNTPAQKTVNKQEQEENQAAKEYDQQANSDQLTMHVRVAAPFREYYDGQAFSISAVNHTGPFDILPKHHNFISLLSECELVIRALIKDQQELIKIAISGGIMHVKEDEVIVFLDV